jgi:hypothetical protein
MKKYSPVVIFSYNRIDNIKKLLKSLNSNIEFKKSDLYIFQDNYRDSVDKNKVINVINYLKKLRSKKQFNLVIREKNFGLAKNIIQGVSEVLKTNSSAIFLEDDLIVSKNFLKFMNLNLIFYKNQKKVWHISGWNYNVNFNIEEDAYFTRGMNCWGWGTWRDRWKYFEKKPNVIIKSWTKNKIFRFNFDNSINFFSQIIRNHNEDINTWAIFWYAVIFTKNGLCLNPVKSLVKNTGIGKYATHTKFIEKIFKPKLNISYIKKYKLPKEIEENKLAYNLIVANFFKMKKLNLFNKFLIKAKNLARC